MALLQDLIQQIDDLALRDRICKETDRILKQKKFGLVFEDHLPECTPLYEMPIKVGGKVAKKSGYVSDIFTVLKIDGSSVLCDNKETHEQVTFNMEELVAIAEFGEAIYPTLQMLDTVENAPESDLWHTLIEADNYHALQLLEYLYAGKVDCIYIDPPYNTGAKDWKYNNDYVDGNDQYRHSKWLSMMEKRLKLAKKLLNPADSVLIVTIDEKEYLHLGCLLEELFPEANMQMISSVIKSGTSMRQYEFSRSNEYIFYLRLGAAVIEKEIPENVNSEIPWRPLMRSGTGSNNFRPQRPNSFYPILIDKDGNLNEIGDPLLPLSSSPLDIDVPEELIAIWPLDSRGRERVWGLSADTLRDNFSKGYAKIKRGRSGFTVQYITTGVINAINEGEIIVTGRDKDGGIEGAYSEGKSQMPQNQWNNSLHNATTYGTNLLHDFIGDRFTFPKSLYAVRDTLNHVLRRKNNALILDFFAGSGTTLHAVNLLNAEDGGNRRCIMVTNNEVSADEAKALTKKGFKPGDEEWEKLGIAKYVNWPRTVCSIEGHDINGKPLEGSYIGSNAPMADGFKSNAAFMKLTFLDKTSVALGKQFKEILPVLWMKGGAIGGCPKIESDEVPCMLVLYENKMAILTDETHYAEFDAELAKHKNIETIFIITDSELAFREMIKGYESKTCYQLYRDYLDNFRINTVR